MTTAEAAETQESKKVSEDLENIIGLAIGKHTHTALSFAGGAWTEEEIPNCIEGCERLRDLLDSSKTLIFTGNGRWALPLWNALAKAFGVSQQRIRNIPKPTQKGKRENIKKFLRSALENGNRGRAVTEGKYSSLSEEKKENEAHPWYQLALEYRERSNDVRRAKHRLLSELSVLFPECVRPSAMELKKQKKHVEPLPPDIWTKKMATALQHPDPSALAKRQDIPAAVRELAEKSTGRFISAQARAHHMTLHQENLNQYARVVLLRNEALERVRKAAGESPMARHFKNSESALVLAALIGWRKWPWKELRSFAGLAVTRVDEKGIPRISRVRGEIRQYLYILRKTNIGKELSALAPEIIQRLKDEKKRSRLIKEMEKLLKNLWRMYLRQEQSEQSIV